MTLLQCRKENVTLNLLQIKKFLCIITYYTCIALPLCLKSLSITWNCNDRSLTFINVTLPPLKWYSYMLRLVTSVRVTKNVCPLEISPTHDKLRLLTTCSTTRARRNMTKRRVRVKGGRGSKWRKGQSSASNPGTRIHRNAAKGRFGNHLSQVVSPVGFKV